MRDAPYSALVRAVLSVVMAATAAELMAQQKAPIPDAEAQTAAKKVAGEIYGGRFKQAKTAAQKSALAKDILDAASKVGDGSADQYVLLEITRDIAARAGDVETALGAVQVLAQRFDVPAAKLKAETLLTASRNASFSTQHAAVAEAASKVLDELAAADEYQTAIKLCETAQASARRARQYALVKKLAARAESLEQQEKAQRKYREALAVLEKKPGDPAANLAAGRYLCFVKGDWGRGVAMLALGSDADLKALAARDLKGAESAEEQAALGDAWWALAETRKGPEKEALMLRAGSWYRAAQVGVSGLVKVKIEKRLEEIDAEQIPELSNKGHQLVFKFDDEAFTGQYWQWKGEWSMAGDGGKAPRGPSSILRTRHAYGGNLSIDMDFSFGQAKFSNTGGCWLTVWGKRLPISNAWRGLSAKVHIQREGDEIVFVHNGQEKRVPVESSVWSKPTVIQVYWRSRTSHFRRIEIKAQTMVAVK